ncbi:hypothetical protein [Mycobacterium sp. IS-836]|uniref:hypothetical protein n=1 Tax=Mycobacterium sp. IS-836 TaxID=1834160 RepID=UPI001152F636|nr:hypothetical protein [Mycobacterium sp. IS-836]
MVKIYKTLTPRQYVREYGARVPIGIQTVKVPVFNVRLAKHGRTHKQDGDRDGDYTVCGLPITPDAVAGREVTCQGCIRGLRAWIDQP